MEKFINEYLEFIRQDYAKWSAQSPTEVRIRMTKEFQESVGFEVGSKYIKVYAGANQRSVHSFICREDTGKFKKGDILKAAGWSAPAKNFARGNVLTKQYGATTWTGAM
jgi:hypothetical protein